MKKISNNGINPNSITFESILSQLAGYFIIDKDTNYLLDILLASCISLELKNPLFMMIQAPSSSGKSAFIKLLYKIDNFHKHHCLTPKTLFSGHSNAEGGYIPSQIGEKGILCTPDFTTVLSDSKQNQMEIFSQLRIAYDGEGGRSTGVDVKNIQKYQWKGKIACICAVTCKIEEFKSSTSDLGERFIFYRYEVKALNPKERMKFDKSRVEFDLETIQNDTKKLIGYSIKVLNQIQVTNDDKLYIIHAAQFIATMRSVVGRDSYSREINYVNPPENPYRLEGQLKALLICLKSLNQIDENRPKRVLQAVILSCIPEIRLKIIEILMYGKKLITSIIANQLSLPDTTVKKQLEDMNAQNIIDQSTGKKYKATQWHLSSEIKDLYNAILDI